MLLSSDKEPIQKWLIDNPDFLKALTYREREIIRCRYGLSGDGFVYSLEETGRIFKVTRERIRQVERKVLKMIAAVLQGGV